MLPYIILSLSLLLFVQSLLSVYLMLYSWQRTDLLEASKGPAQLLAPQLSFTVLLPARHEEAVIYETIKKVCQTNYPSDLLEVVVICHSDDKGTIAEAQRAINEINSWRVRIATFADTPINKPHALNVGLRGTFHDVVTIFDAEDDIHANIFHVINTVMLQERVRIVQAGVQLMNFRDYWFAVHNCMEYFFWFKSRLLFHAKMGMIPLGGNTVFIHRTLLEKIGGWDDGCLTEDAEIGLRLSALGEPIRVIYDQRYVTREETPPDVASFIRQRTRWQQGFLQVLWKGTWLSLPRFNQRLLAFYTFSYPFTQALLTLLWLPTIITMLWLKLSVITSLISFLPLYSLSFQFITTLIGTYIFTREYKLKFPLYLPFTMALTFLPFQWLQGISSLRVVYRVLFRMQDWEKTLHIGAHRQSSPLPIHPQSQLEEQDTVVLALPQQHIPIAPAQRGGLPATTASVVAPLPYVTMLRAAEPIVLEERDMVALENADEESTQPRPAQRGASPTYSASGALTQTRPHPTLVRSDIFEELNSRLADDDEATAPHRALRLTIITQPEQKQVQEEGKAPKREEQ